MEVEGCPGRGCVGSQRGGIVRSVWVEVVTVAGGGATQLQGIPVVVDNHVEMVGSEGV